MKPWFVAVILSTAGLGCGAQSIPADSPLSPTGHRDIPQENDYVLRAFHAYGCTAKIDSEPGRADRATVRLATSCNGIIYTFMAEPDGSISAQCDGNHAKECAGAVAKIYRVGEQCANGTRHCNE